MSLYTQRLEQFYIVEKTETRDGYGGTSIIYEKKDPFFGALVLKGTNIPEIAQKAEIEQNFSIITDKSDVLKFEDVLFRVKNGKYYEVTTNGEDNYTPETASLNMRAVDVKELVGGIEGWTPKPQNNP